MHKNTKKYRYIQTARRMADYFIDNLPDDGVVPWCAFLLTSLAFWFRYSRSSLHRDFNAPLTPPRPADSSAAMIAANGLLLLAREELSIHNATGAKHYTASAIKVRISHRACIH